MILAVDTSTDTISVAFYEAYVHAEETWVSGQQHATQLLPEVQHMMKRLGIKASELKGVAVALGPGSFNGLRVGLSAAKGLCFALGIPIAGVGTLEAWAYQYAGLGLPVRCITDAGRGDFNTALYQMKNGEWTEVEAPWAGSIALIRDRINEPTFVCGDIRKEPIARLDHELGDRVTMPNPAGALRRCGYLAELGIKKLRAGKDDELKSLQPIYLRRPAITKSRRADVLAVRGIEGKRSKGGASSEGGG